MVNKTPPSAGFETRAIRAGQVRTPESEHNDPIFTTSSFVFESAADAAAKFAEREPGNVYSRFTNPTVKAFEARLASLEGAKHCIATSSGMAAILTLALGVLKAGDHVVVSNSLFGATLTLFGKILTRFGVAVDYVPLKGVEHWRNALRETTRFVFLETPSNPLCEIADIAELAECLKNRDTLLVVDNCYCTPVLQRPLEFGADIVIHSATKFLDGQGRCVGGAILCNDKALHDEFYAVMRSAGPAMSPFNAWVFLKGLETLSLRMRAHSDNALALAKWLESHPKVRRVYYPGLPSHPQFDLASRQQQGHGGVLSFEVDGGRDAAWRVIDGTSTLSITANLGDAKTTITHPASTTHARITAEQRAAAGITEGLIRIAVGLETLQDIRDDVAQGLDRLTVARLAAAD